MQSAAVQDVVVGAGPEGARRIPALLFAVAAVLVLGAGLASSLPLIGSRFAGFLYWDNGVLVGVHRPSWTGFDAGLPLNGGLLVSAGGRPFERGSALRERISRLSPGTPVPYRTALADRSAEFTVPTMTLSVTDFAVTLGNYLLNGTALLVVGALALLLRPDLAAVRALAFATGTLGTLMILAVDYVTAYRFVLPCRLVEGLAPAALANLALVFPTERLRPGRRLAVVAALGVAGLALQAWGTVAFYEDPARSRLVASWIYAAIGVALLCLLGNYGETLVRARTPLQRAQAAVVFAGALPAFALAGAGLLVFTLLRLGFSLSWVFALLPLAPISMLYAMVRQDIFESERFVRLTIGYTLASALILIPYAASLVLLERLVVTETATSPAAAFLLILVAALSFDPLRRRVQSAIDRAFYRSRLDAARELEATSEELAILRSEGEIADAVSRRLRLCLGLEWARARQDDANPPPGVALSHELSVRGEPLGTLECGPKRSGAPFSGEELDFVRGLAAQTALALHHARTLAALREAQVALLRNARMAALGELAGAVAHGIRNPLAGISAAAQVASGDLEDGPAADAVASVLAEAGRIEQRVRSLLQFARAPQSSVQDTDLCRLVGSIAEAMGGLAERSQIAIATELPDESVRRQLDPNLLREALLELASNAIQAMPDGGSLRLSLRREAGRIALEVADSGPGIPEHLRERVFDVFFTTRPAGTGMGLATVRRIVEAMGGAVELGEEEGAGATFRIHLG